MVTTDQETTKLHPVLVRLRGAELDALRRRAEAEDRSMATIIRRALRAELEKTEPKP